MGPRRWPEVRGGGLGGSGKSWERKGRGGAATIASATREGVCGRGRKRREGEGGGQGHKKPAGSTDSPI